MHTHSIIDTLKEDNEVHTHMKEINTFYDIYGSPEQVRSNNTDIDSDYTTSTLSMPNENSCGNKDLLDLDTDNTSLSFNNGQQNDKATEIVETENVHLSSSFITNLSSDKEETDKESVIILLLRTMKHIIAIIV
ncbi:uncharacterized protein LOC109861936 [Pseudomyrmex gracilis]|uniref:uncharacterized protein LOC109861936 n=1 Tax=Pseudomyrmex gracilis TaxID=219809 RepID=UPI000995ACC2|nr:uncharacterized protein LOC109861936 [Pseudomyrmex gracilis]